MRIYEFPLWCFSAPAEIQQRTWERNMICLLLKVECSQVPSLKAGNGCSCPYIEKQFSRETRNITSYREIGAIYHHFVPQDNVDPSELKDSEHDDPFGNLY